MNACFPRTMLCVLMVLLAIPPGLAAETYEADWQSLDARPNPQWYRDAHFGIFIHWGLYSVPAWGARGSYAEWYLKGLQAGQGDRFEWHNRIYGPDFDYRDFAPMFRAENFDPRAWADLFARAGARYVVLTSKHHDGFCLWPNAESQGYNSVETGAGRDLIGDLSLAVRDRGLRMGLYFSLYEWDHPLYPDHVDRYVDEYLFPQFKDLVVRYQPAVIFADGEWDHGSEVWRSEELLAWLYNESPAPEDVVVNDRWGGETRFKHGGYFSTEYEDVGAETSARFIERGWEECRGIGSSFGYNRNEDIEDYVTGEELIRLLVEIVSRGGNLLLNVGPTADGRIPVIMQERLLQIGTWLDINGEAIYGSRPYRVFNDGESLRFTRSGDGEHVYVISMNRPPSELTVPAVQGRDGGRAVLLDGTDSPPELQWMNTADGMVIGLPDGCADLPCVVRVDAKQWIDKPTIETTTRIAVDEPLSVELSVEPGDAQVHYTLDGTEPTPRSPRYDGPFDVASSGLLRARAFKPGWSASLETEAFISVLDSRVNGLNCDLYTGQWEILDQMIEQDPDENIIAWDFDFTGLTDLRDDFGLVWHGEIDIAVEGEHTFATVSDDGSRLWIDERLVVDNDGLHGRARVEGKIDLSAGRHRIEVQFFERGGGEVLEVLHRGPDTPERAVPACVLYR